MPNDFGLKWDGDVFGISLATYNCFRATTFAVDGRVEIEAEGTAGFVDVGAFLQASAALGKDADYFVYIDTDINAGGLSSIFGNGGIFTGTFRVSPCQV